MSCGEATSVPIPRSLRDYSCINERINSFENRECPFYTPEDMAKSVFFFTGERDIVKCFESQLEVGNWRNGISLMAKHRGKLPICNYVRSLDFMTAPRRVSFRPPPAEVEKDVMEVNTVKCKICLDEKINCIFLPCSLVMACISCAVAFNNCSICRERI